MQGECARRRGVWNLSAGWLGEPQGPLVHQGMLDIEVVLVVKDSDLLFAAGIAIGLLVLVDSPVRRDRNSREVDGFRCSGGGHDVCCFDHEIRWL